MSIFRGISSVRGLNRFASVTAAAVHQNPVPAAGEIVLTTNFVAGSYFGRREGSSLPGSDCIVLTTTTYYKIEFWDGTSQVVSPSSGTKYVFGVGTSSTGIGGQFAKLVTSAYDGLPKNVRIYSCNSSGTKQGSIRGISFPASSISFADVSQATILTHVNLSAQQSDYYELGSSNKASLTIILNNATLHDLSLDSSDLTSLNLNGCTYLIGLGIANNSSIDYSVIDPRRSQLQYFYGGRMNSTYADLSFMASLVRANMFFSTEQQIDITDCFSLVRFHANASPNLTNVLASGVGGAMTYSTYSTYSSFASGFHLANCNLNSFALDDLYSSIDYGSGSIIVSGNPGASSDDPTIATAKGWTVYGS